MNLKVMYMYLHNYDIYKWISYKDLIRGFNQKLDYIIAYKKPRKKYFVKKLA